VAASMSDFLVEKFEDIVLPESDICVQEIVAVTGGLTDWRIHLEFMGLREPGELVSHGLAWRHGVVVRRVNEKDGNSHLANRSQQERAK
jgi:hypothetical protein